MTRPAATLLALALLLAACGAEPTTGAGASPTGDAPAPTATPTGAATPTAGDDPAAGDGRVWFDLLATSETDRRFGTIHLATDAGELEALWEEHGFPRPPPPVPFDEQVVLVATRPQGGCVDELVEMRLGGDRLEPTWLPWPGPCEAPLLSVAFAVALHRGSLPERFTVVQRESELFDADAELDAVLPPYEGPPAPEAPDPPRRMSDAEVEEVFAGHPLRRCEEMPRPETDPEVDGPRSDDPEVASIQDQRAYYGLPSDEATVRERMADPEADTSFGFPMTASELDALTGDDHPGFAGDFQSRYVPEHARDTWTFLMVDRPGGGEYVAGFTADLDEHRERLARRYPGVPLRLVETLASERELRAAQEALGALMGTGERPHVLHSGFVAHLEVGVLDPTRADLDTIAEVVDPAIACVEVIRSGL